MSSLRVLLVTQYFPPEVGAAPTRAAHFARALARAGHLVHVVTGLPNHPSGRIQPSSRPGHEVWEGISVTRVWLFAATRKNFLTRLWNQLSFAAAALPAILTAGSADVVLVTVPPVFVGLTAWLGARRYRAPLIVDCRDDWPRAALALGEMRRGPAATLLQTMASALYRRAARVVAVTPGMQRSLAQRGVDEGRITLVTNGADTETFRPSPLRNGNNPVRVIYAGTHGLIHGMDVLLDAAERLKPRGVRFLLVGDGVAKRRLEATARARALDNVDFQPSLPPDRLAELMRDADICVATTRAHPFCGETIPVKLFDYLAAGRPVVGAVIGDAAEVLRASGGGLVVPPEDGRALTEALESLGRDPKARAEMGARAARFVEKEYSRKILGDRLARLVEEVVLKARGRSVVPLPAGFAGAFKRGLDLALAVIMVLVFLPVLALLALAIRLDSPGPALFYQRRVGRGSREFVIFKFRTMRVGTPDLASHLVGGADTMHVTRLGGFFRRTSLDELPQLFNVIRGEMSLVGPRPALFNQDDLIALRQQAGVDALRPGVTGWAQINGRDDIGIDRKVELDRFYLEHSSLWLDAAIIVRTALTLFSARGVN